MFRKAETIIILVRTQTIRLNGVVHVLRKMAYGLSSVIRLWCIAGVEDGENAIMADFDNEMVNAALSSDGKVVSSQTWNTTVSMWYGTEKLTLDSITCTPDTNLLCATDKNIWEWWQFGICRSYSCCDKHGEDHNQATKNGQQYSRDLSFTVAGCPWRCGRFRCRAIQYNRFCHFCKQGQEWELQRVFRIMLQAKVSGGRISTTTDGTLKYSIDGGAETSINNNTAISSGNFTKTLKFIFYVNDQIVDVETRSHACRW